MGQFMINNLKYRQIFSPINLPRFIVFSALIYMFIGEGFASQNFCDPTVHSSDRNGCIEIDHIRNTRHLSGKHTGLVKNGKMNGVGSLELANGKLIARFEDNNVQGWAINDTEDAIEYLFFEDGQIMAGKKRLTLSGSRNLSFIITFKTDNLSETSPAQIELADGRIFIGRLKIENGIVPDKYKGRGAIYYPNNSSKDVYYGEVEVWTGGVDAHGVGRLRMKSGKIDDAEWWRSTPGNSKRRSDGIPGRIIAGVITLGLTEVGRLGEDILEIAKASEFEANEAANILNSINFLNDTQKLFNEYSSNLSIWNKKKISSTFDQYREKCLAFGYQKNSSEISDCMKDLYTKAQELEVLERVKAEELRVTKEIKNNEAKALANIAERRDRIESNRSSLNAINSYLDREQRRRDALNTRISNQTIIKSPTNCTSRRIGNTVNTRCF